jgi:hypothetical protein
MEFLDCIDSPNLKAKNSRMKSNAKVIMPAFLLLTAGCITPQYSTQMLADGNTWKIRYGQTAPWESCVGWIDDPQECIADGERHIRQIAESVCGETPYRVFSCGELSTGNYVECDVQCKKMPELRTFDSTKSPPRVRPAAGDVLEHAKKCQLKGGIWVNDTCQISLD